MPWHEFKPLFTEHRDRLFWNRASFLSVEQRRRRQGNSSLPREHHELAVLGHAITDPDRGEIVPCRVIFVFSSADQKVCRQERDRAVAKIREGLEGIARSVARGHRLTREATPIHRRVAKLLGKRGAARYFRWELVPLTSEEQANLPPPQRVCTRPTQRFVFHYDEAAAQADALQRQILDRLGFPTSAQTLSRRLPRYPPE